MHPLNVELVMLVAKGDSSLNNTTVPAVEDGQGNVGVALFVTITVAPALPVPPPPPPPVCGTQLRFPLAFDDST